MSLFWCDWNCLYCSFTSECYPEGVDTDLSNDTNLAHRNMRLSIEQGEEFVKTGKLPVAA